MIEANGSGSGGGASRPHTPPEEEATLIRHEEEATVSKQAEESGRVSVRRTVATDNVRQQYPRVYEHVTQERVPAGEGDSGEVETLPDGSVSIPIFEEELVVTKQTVLRERVIVRKEVATEWQVVQAELRRERVEIDSSGAPDGAVTGAEQFERRGFGHRLLRMLRQME